MAGGLFPGKPFALNIKCVIFSLICMGLLMYCPPKFANRWMLYILLFLVFVISYVALAWYDYFFNCSTLPLKKGKHSALGKVKPPSHEKEKQEEHKEDNKDVRRKKYLVYLFHLLFIVPLLIYIVKKGKKAPQKVFTLLGAVAGMTAVYHGYHLINMVH